MSQGVVTLSALLGDRSRRRVFTQRLGTVLVHAGSGEESEALTRSAVDVANLFGARLIGVTTAPSIASAAMSDVEADAVQLVLEGGARRFEKLSAAVRAGAVWRSAVGSPVSALRGLALSADLLMINVRQPPADCKVSATLRTLVTRSARPVLVRPPGAARTDFQRVAVLWDGSPASVRALSSAMPFLGRAERVDLIIFSGRALRSPDAASVIELRTALRLRGVEIEQTVVADEESWDPGDLDADLLVTGAWRYPEWLSFLDPTERLVSRLQTFALLSN